MFEIHPRVNRFRADLVASGFLGTEANEIMQGLESEILAQVKELVIDAVDDAVNIATSMGIDMFAEDVTVGVHGYFYRIVTKSGKTDYSTQPIDMKPHLLQKAQISKDGSRYRRIPIKEKRSTNDFFAAQEEQFLQQVRERESRVAARKIANETFAATDSIADSVDDMAQMRKRFYEMKRAKDARGETNIRTVSDKSPEDSWIIPARNMDMTIALNKINERLAQHIEDIIDSAVQLYVEEFI